MNSPFDILLEPAEQKNTHVAPIRLTDQSGPYRIGKPTRPPIKHDNGHLDKFPSREPDAEDYKELAKWIAYLEGSEAFCTGKTKSIVPLCKGEDLSDANAAYRHFLFGKGADRTLNYERFLADDPVGKRVIGALSHGFKLHIEIIGKDRTKFSVTSDAFTVGDGGIAPYPETANWQKTLGGHNLWVSGDVTAAANKEGQIVYTASLTIHMEDRYNFNPGQHDVATGIPDAANGRFETSGLGKQYTNYATVHRDLTWVEGSWDPVKPTGGPSDRQRKPRDNRRLRNNI